MSQTAQIDRTFTHLTWSTTVKQLQPKLEMIHWNKKKQDSIQKKQIRATFLTLTNNIEKRQTQALYAYRRTRIVTKKLRSVHQHIYSLQQT